MNLTNISQRELDILDKVSHGYTREEMASLVFLSPNTVSSHIKSLFKKLKAKNKAHLVMMGSKLAY